MFEKALTLFERLVIAVETLAAQKAGADVPSKEEAKAAATEKASTKGKTTRGKTSAKAKDDADEDTAEEEKSSKGKTTRGRGKSSKADDKTATLRNEIKEMATSMAADDSDEADEIMADFDGLLEKFDVKNVSKLADEDVADFHEELKEIFDGWFDTDGEE